MRRPIFALGILLVLAGCSKPPLRPVDAARLIREAADFRDPANIGVGRDDAPSDCKAKMQEDADWRALSKIGWVEFRDEDDYMRETGGRPAVKCVGRLTGEGLRSGAASETTTYQNWRVPVATRELVAVTAVTPSEDGISTARFNYRWRLNALGSQLFQPPPEAAGKAVFRLLDDGWHLADFTSLPAWAADRLPSAAR
jgi:hypothetical protein